MDSGSSSGFNDHPLGGEKKPHHFLGKSAYIQIQSHLLPSLSVDLMHECTVGHGSSHHLEDKRKTE